MDSKLTKDSSDLADYRSQLPIRCWSFDDRHRYDDVLESLLSVDAADGPIGESELKRVE